MSPLFLPAIKTLVLCEYSKIFEDSNSYFTIRFDSKRVQLFDIFKYVSLLHNAVFGNYNGEEHNKLLPSLAPIDAIFGSYSCQTATIVSRHYG